MNVLRQFEQLIGKLSGAAGWLAGWLCILMIAVVFIDVIARYGFDSGSIAMREMEWHLFAAVFLLGAAYTMREDANVRVDVFYQKCRLAGRPWSIFLAPWFLSFPVFPDFIQFL